MAVESDAAPNQMLNSPEKEEIQPLQVALPSSPPRRNNAPGVRHVGTRIYDPVNGKSCHQCRQKTRALSAACENQRKNKNNSPCSINYCHKCLWNRYREKAGEVDASGEWICPKCRGICNCSVCMRRNGFKPTGVFGKKARKTGFVAVMTASPTKLQEIASSPIKRGKENSYDGQGDANLPSDNGKKSKNVKRKLEQECHAKIHDDNKELGAEDTGLCDSKKSKKMKRGRSDEKDKINHVENLKEKSANDDTTEEDEIITENALVVSKQHNADFHPNKPLPMGTELITVAGIAVPAQDAGNVVQFIEFCASFGKVLEVDNGQPEHVLQDLFHGRAGRPGKFSVTVHFLIHLLSILLTELGEQCGELSPSAGKNSWFDALKKCCSQTQSILKVQGLDLEKTSDYESLEASEKLKLLNFLCDELLGTEKVRSWMDKQSSELAENVKEARKKVTAAKNQVKILKQKIKDDVAEAIIARNGAPLTFLEHEAIVSLTKNKAEEACAKVLESQGILLESKRICNALRTEPLLVEHGGNAYWKLNCFGNSNVLCQDVGKGDTLTLNEKWFTLDEEGKEAVEKHICSLSGKKQRF